MEARQALGASSLANGVRIVIAIFVAMVLVGAFAMIGKDLGTSSGAGQTVVHPAPGTVLRQDYDRESAPSAPSIYVQGGRTQAVYDEIRRGAQS